MVCGPNRSESTDVTHASESGRRIGDLMSYPVSYPRSASTMALVLPPKTSLPPPIRSWVVPMEEAVEAVEANLS